ncbi:hypothetical protein KCU89_g34, partial [Aureobasidium melanogenum]
MCRPLERRFVAVPLPRDCAATGGAVRLSVGFDPVGRFSPGNWFAVSMEVVPLAPSELVAVGSIAAVVRVGFISSDPPSDAVTVCEVDEYEASDEKAAAMVVAVESVPVDIAETSGEGD